MKYSDYLMQTVAELGYTHCFYVAGGNSMHLLESASRFFECVPVVHEVTASIAAEYFCESGGAKAFSLVTAGPGLTNSITGIAGAWLESHELLIIGGQVKKENLKTPGVRQGGIQEIDGVTLLKSITKSAVRIDSTISSIALKNEIRKTFTGRKGPVFLEVCLDTSASEVNFELSNEVDTLSTTNIDINLSFDLRKSEIEKLIKSCVRPYVLLGNGLSRKGAETLLSNLSEMGIPVGTTWSGADRAGFDYPHYAGRPNTFGMRWANIFQQQADLLIVIGSSLGLQQTGFNTELFMNHGTIIHVDIDRDELLKKNPKSRTTIQMDADEFANELPSLFFNNWTRNEEWTKFLTEVKSCLPLVEDSQKSKKPYISPHEVIQDVSRYIDGKSEVVVCSSGGTFTAGLQCFQNKIGQIMLSNKGLASMGYGLAGAIGLAFSKRHKSILLFEGDGGFAQNLQELGTVSANSLNIKMFITNNEGYASIRTSQKNYFSGHYLGCDVKTGLGFPNWSKISESFEIAHFRVDANSFMSKDFIDFLESEKPVLFEVMADPEQMYLPKVSSSLKSDGSMESTAIHDMVPRLPDEIAAKVFKYIESPQ